MSNYSLYLAKNTSVNQADPNDRDTLSIWLGTVTGPDFVERSIRLRYWDATDHTSDDRSWDIGETEEEYTPMSEEVWYETRRQVQERIESFVETNSDLFNGMVQKHLEA